MSLTAGGFGIGIPSRSFSSTDYLFAAALFSLGAGIIHARATFDHLGESPLIASFFAVTAVLQVAWADLVWSGPRRWLLIAGCAGSALIFVTWVLSRTVGVPVGDTPWKSEAVGAIDVIASTFEVGVIIAIARAWGGPLPDSLAISDLHPSVLFLAPPVIIVALYSVVVGH